jgi:hypothetical protein
MISRRDVMLGAVTGSPAMTSLQRLEEPDARLAFQH